jgi:Na+/H+ antiporter NhaD/arsenite permease-like protein
VQRQVLTFQGKLPVTVKIVLNYEQTGVSPFKYSIYIVIINNWCGFNMQLSNVQNIFCTSRRMFEIYVFWDDMQCC